MKSKAQTPNKYVLEDENHKVFIMSYEEMIAHIKDDNSKHKVLGKLINVMDIQSVEKYDREITELKEFKSSVKLKIMQLVRNNINMFRDKSQENIIYNFKELISKNL